VSTLIKCFRARRLMPMPQKIYSLIWRHLFSSLVQRFVNQ
jgi:hypothetical protein